MPNIKSAIKRAQIEQRNNLRNKAYKSAIRTAKNHVLESFKAKNKEEMLVNLNKAYSQIDRAVSKGVLHKNAAARKKSRLALAIAKLSS